jgi:hypothetical protein
MVEVGNGVGDDGLRAVRVEVALAVDEVLDELAVREDNGGVLEALEGVDAAILLSPLGEAVRLLEQILLHQRHGTHWRWAREVGIWSSLPKRRAVGGPSH